MDEMRNFPNIILQITMEREGNKFANVPKLPPDALLIIADTYSVIGRCRAESKTAACKEIECDEIDSDEEVTDHHEEGTVDVAQSFLNLQTRDNLLVDYIIMKTNQTNIFCKGKKLNGLDIWGKDLSNLINPVIFILTSNNVSNKTNEVISRSAQEVFII